MLVDLGLQGCTQEEVLFAYCDQLVALGVPVYRLHVAQRAFHPQFGGIGFDWTRGSGVSREQYEHREIPLSRWTESPMYYLLQSGLPELREDLSPPEHVSKFPMLNELKASGATDYLATAIAFEKNAPEHIDPNNTPEGMLISWTSDAPGGFADAQVTLLRQTLGHLGLALKSASNRQMAQDLLRVYLGQDPGRRVLSGEIQRGSLQQISAVVCYFDLTGFTSLAESLPGEAVIAMLNDYFEMVVTVIRDHGGHVLKFMGDGLLAMFDKPDPSMAASHALDAASALLRSMADLNTSRRPAGLPCADCTLALHSGEILYGNIGAPDRLDFTVIGPAVNLASRLADMHRALGQAVLISEPVYQAVQNTSHDIVPLGRYMLRGISSPHRLYTLYRPDVAAQT